MIFETKFNYGDLVYPISTEREEIKVPTNCKLCHDTGKIELNEESFTCPKCKGHTYHCEYGEVIWYVSSYSKGKIGNIRINDYDIQQCNRKREIEYMLNTTGCGSVWKEENLFLTIKEAQNECDKRNKEIKDEANKIDN